MMMMMQMMMMIEMMMMMMMMMIEIMMTTMAIYKLCHVSPDKKSLNASAKSPLHFSFLV